MSINSATYRNEFAFWCVQVLKDRHPNNNQIRIHAQVDDGKQMGQHVRCGAMFECLNIRQKTSQGTHRGDIHPGQYVCMLWVLYHLVGHGRLHACACFCVCQPGQPEDNTMSLNYVKFWNISWFHDAERVLILRIGQAPSFNSEIIK